MRIIAGSARGRRLAGPRGAVTRPPTDRMKEGLFSALGDVVDGAVVIDLYAGTGSFGLEALSRGATSATFVERDRQALRALRLNIATVALGGAVIVGDVESVLRREEGPFSLAFVDPPYALPTESVAAVLETLAGRLEQGADVIVHRRRDQEPTSVPGTLLVVKRRRYGDAEVWWYTKEAQ